MHANLITAVLIYAYVMPPVTGVVLAGAAASKRGCLGNRIFAGILAAMLLGCWALMVIGYLNEAA